MGPARAEGAAATRIEPRLEFQKEPLQLALVGITCRTLHPRGGQRETARAVRRPLQLDLAREVARLTGWTGKIWERRYQAIPISDEEEAQAARLRYVLGHGVKETLVAHLREWPRLHCVHQIVDGEPFKHATSETVTLSPLPCWKHLSPEAYRECVANLASEIEDDAATARSRTGIEPLGVAAILAQEPTSRPKRLKKSPAPLFHAASQVVRHYLYERFSWFVAAYRTAAEKLQRGDPDPHFPLGCFPPALPFVGG